MMQFNFYVCNYLITLIRHNSLHINIKYYLRSNKYYFTFFATVL